MTSTATTTETELTVPSSDSTLLQACEVVGSSESLAREAGGAEDNASSSTIGSEKRQSPKEKKQQQHETIDDMHRSRRVTKVRQLFVGNLPFRVRWQDLKDLFRKAGNVVRADVALSYDNRSKGHGTVLFNTVEDAQRAIDMLHNYKWQGRALEVREDKAFIEQSSHLAHPSSSNTRGAANDPCDTKIAGGRQLFVGNLPFHCQWQDVKDLFRNAGNILRADVMQGTDGRSRGFGTVLYASHEDAKRAIVMYNGYEFHGRRIRVHFDKFASASVAPSRRYAPNHHSQPLKPILELTQPYPHPPPSPYHAQHISPLLTPVVYFPQPEPGPTYHHFNQQHQHQQPVTPLTDEDSKVDFSNAPGGYLPTQSLQHENYPFHLLIHPPHSNYLGFSGLAASLPLESNIQNNGITNSMYPTHALDAVKSVGGFFVPGQAWSSSPKMPLATAPPLSPPVFPSTTTEQQQRHDSSPLYVPGITQGPAPPADISLAEAMNAIHMKEGTAGLAESLRNVVATTKAEQGSGGSAITTGVAASIDLTRVWEPLDGLKY